jgi:D-aspartate ligase
MPKNIAWVLGMFETGLTAARSLGRADIPVIGVDSDPSIPGCFSRYVHFLKAPSPLTHPDDLAEWFVRQGKQLDAPGVLLPATDIYVEFISHYRDALSPYFKFALPSVSVVGALIDKFSHARLAKAHGEKCPETYEISSKAQSERLARCLKYPVFLKGQCPYQWQIHFNNKGFLVDNPQELVEYYSQSEQAELGAIVQEIIPGPATQNFEVSFYRSIQSEARILALLGVRKIRQYPPNFGSGSLVETGHYPEVISRSLRFAEAIDFRGIGNIEYKLDVRNGEYYLIDLNARLWLQNVQADRCGINFPLIAYHDIIGEAIKTQTEFPDGIKWMDLIGDFQAFWFDFRNGDLDIGSWLKSLKGVRSYATLAWDDPMPVLHEFEYGLKFIKMPIYMLRHIQG